MSERLFFLSPTSRCGFFGTSLTLLFRYGIDFGSAFTTVRQILFKLLFFLEKFIVSLLSNCGHVLTFLLAVIARVKFDLIFPFLYVILVVRLLLLCRRGGLFYDQSDFDLIYLHLSPFYRQIFNLLPLLLCFYYSTLASIMSRLFSDFFDILSKNFPQVKQG